MTELLEQAFRRVRALSPDMQDEFARVLLRLAGDDELVYLLTAEEEADLTEAEAEISRGELVTDAEVEAVLCETRVTPGATADPSIGPIAP
ncbi:MAG: hypothetical protein ABW026_16300 [Microvirga sp.]